MMVVMAGLFLVVGRARDTALVVGKEKDIEFP